MMHTRVRKRFEDDFPLAYSIIIIDSCDQNQKKKDTKSSFIQIHYVCVEQKILSVKFLIVVDAIQTNKRKI